jgi:hypothetical protein
VFCQRLFSPERPLTNFMAADNLFSQARAFSSTSAFWRSASARSRLSPSTFSLSTLTLSLTTARSFFFYSRSSDALSFLSTIGLTSLKILLYVIIEIDQRHKQAAA